MKARHVLIAAVAALGAVGCGAGAAEEPEQAAAPAPTTTWSPKQTAYLATLGKLDEGLVVNETRAIRRAEETCADIKGGMAGGELAERVVARLSGGNATINRAQAGAAIAAMKANVC